MKLITLYVLCFIGGFWVLRYIVWPIIESIVFGHISHILSLINIDWAKTKWTKKSVLWLFVNPWEEAFDRLLGNGIYTSSIIIGDLEYIPPFKIKKKNRGANNG